MSIGRRRFIELSAGMAAAMALPACAAMAVTRVISSGGAIRLALRDHPRLTQPSGYLRVQTDEEAAPLFVFALGGDRYVALSPICTHLGCTVNVEGTQLVCPCHGSTYDRAGQVLRGPAERPLRQFPTAVSGDGELVIQLRGEL